jgi:phosphonatase-like hydrolase
MGLIDLVVFDMAGTTIKDQCEVENCFWEAAEQTGLITTRERIVSMMGWSKRLVFETLWKEQLADVSAVEIDEKTQTSYVIFKQVLENHYRNEEVVPTDGCLEVFKFLKSKNIRIGLTTGFYREVSDIILYKTGWLAESAFHGVSPTVDFTVASDEVSLGRPYPYMIFKMMQALQVQDVRKVIKIGDTPSDLGEGKNAGCLFSFGVTNGTHTSQQLSACENDGLFSNLSEFRSFLGEYLE